MHVNSLCLILRTAHDAGVECLIGVIHSQTALYLSHDVRSTLLRSWSGCSGVPVMQQEDH